MQAHAAKQSLANLTALNLTGCLIGSAGAAQLAPVLAETSTSLRALCLADNGLNADGCKRICEALSWVTQPAASGSGSPEKPTTSGGSSGGGGGPLALQYLDLSVNNIGEGGCRALGQALCGAGSLQHLLLAANSISAEGAAALAAGLPRLTALVSLQVRAR